MIKLFRPLVSINLVLSLIIAESAVELVPKHICMHPSVAKRARQLGKKADEILLDRSYHHVAMLSLENAEKRGRPDITHFCLLEALGTPLNKEGLLRVYIHTFDHKTIAVAPETRLPRNYDRFTSLIEQLYQTKRVPIDGKPLLTIQDETLKGLLGRLHPSQVVALSVNGERSMVEKVVEPLVRLENPVFLVGGFPRGHFTEDTVNLVDGIFCIDPEGLDAWVIISRIIYDFERASGFSLKRWLHLP